MSACRYRSESEERPLSKVLRGLGRTGIVLLVTVLMILVLALGACGVLAWGPSSEWTRRFVATFDESSAMKFVPRMYLSEATVQSYLHPARSDGGEPEDDLFIELPFEDGTQPDVQTADPALVSADPPRW